jgi:integrase
MVNGIQKRGDKYVFRIRIGDHLVYEGGFASAEDAQAARDKTRVAAREGRLPAVPTRETVAEYLERWLKVHESQVKPTTLASYRMHIRQHIEPALGEIRLKKLDRATLNTFLAHAERRPRLHERPAAVRRPLSPATVRRIAATLHKALADAVDEGTLAANPCDRVKLPKARATEHHDIQAWTASELAAFLEQTLQDRLAPMWWTIANTGMRRGEVAGLVWRDVDLAAGTIAVRRALAIVGSDVVETTPKRGRSRVIDLDADTIAVLEIWRKRQAAERDAWPGLWPASHRVFCHEDGTALHPRYLTRAFGRLVANARVPRIRLHDVRHTHASLLLSAGVPVKVVSERLGHSDVAFTMRVYQHVLPGMQRDAADQFAALLKQARPTHASLLRT